MIVSVFNLKSYAQTENSNTESWFSLKDAAHRIGFCVYQVGREVCEEHSQIKHELEKINGLESEVYYFLLNPHWAKNRLSNWAKSQSSKSEDYFILFDIDQNSYEKLYGSTKTSNSHKMFSIFDLKNKFEFKKLRETDFSLSFYISSNRENSVLSNTMWREYISSRFGRLDSEIKISLNGTNALNDYHNFKEAFMKFMTK